MKIEKVSINGEVSLPDEAKVKAIDDGLLRGIGAFETFRVQGNKVFLLDEHFKRLAKNLDALGVKLSKDYSRYNQWISELCTNIPKGKDGFIRFMVTGGDGQLGLQSNGSGNPHIIIYLAYIPEFMLTDKKAAILEDIVRQKPEYFQLTGFRIKSLDYTTARMVKRTISKVHGTETDGILLSPDSYVAEGLTSNIFWSSEGKLYTPPLSLGILAGTMRQYLMKNYEVEEKLITAKEFEKADEIVFTSGASYLISLSELNGIPKPGISGPVFKKLFSDLRRAVDKKSQNLV